MTRRVTVVGGGLAGITAALRCSDGGAAVTLVEARARLGGLAGSFRRGELEVDTGQHVVLRCCRSYLGLLERLGVRDRLRLQERLDVPVLSPGRRPARLRRHAAPAPLHLAAALARYHPVPVAERLALARAALALRAVDATDPAVDARTFSSWLAEHGQGARATAALWDLVGVATLNATADTASLSLAATVFQLGLLTDPGAGDIGWARVPLGHLHDTAARQALTEAGVEVHTGTRAEELEPADGTWHVGIRERDGSRRALRTDTVVCAVAPDAAARLMPEPLRADAVARAAGLGHSPIVNVHVVYDRRVLDTELAAGLDTPVQWLFDRTASSGADRVWPPGAQYVVVSLSAADGWIGLPAARLREQFLPALARLLPTADRARVLDAFVTREPAATFRPAPGTAALRPGPRTALDGLLLAGAYTDTGWPATLEGAVRSGEAAAAAALDDAPRGTTARRS